jgi:uncharacterized membrane protein
MFLMLVCFFPTQIYGFTRWSVPAGNSKYFALPFRASPLRLPLLAYFSKWVKFNFLRKSAFIYSYPNLNLFPWSVPVG